DRSQPLELRIDAAKKLSAELGYRELLSVFFSIINSEDEDPSLRSALLAVFAFQNPSTAVPMLVGRFESPAVRRAAIEILDKLAPVTGQQELLLTAELAALRGTLTLQEIEAMPLDSLWKQIFSGRINQFSGGPHLEVNRSCAVVNLALNQGRDPRVLAFLNEELHQPSEIRRRDAVFGLCMLGELGKVLGAVNDPSPVVRAALAQRLGWYREVQGVEVLRRLLEDSDPSVSKEAKTALRLLNQLEM